MNYTLLVLHILKEKTDRTQHMKQIDIWREAVKLNMRDEVETGVFSPDKLKQNTKLEIEIRPSYKQVRDVMEGLLEFEEALPKDKRQIGYERKNGRILGYWYVNSISDGELKFLIDSTLYSGVFNENQAQKLITNLQNMSRKHLKDITKYAALFKPKFGLDIDVMENVERILEATAKGKKITFQLNVYQVGKDKSSVCLEKIREVIGLNPHYVVMGNNKYYLIGTYDGSQKCYFFRVDLMTELKILKEQAVPTREIEGLKYQIDWSKFMREHPYMMSGDTVTMRLYVRKEILVQLVDWFGADIELIPDSETEDTIAVRVTASESAMHYWLLQYGENVMRKISKNSKREIAFAEEMIRAAERIAEQYREQLLED